MEKRVPKKTGTYADPLCAIGYASLLEELTGAPSTIRDDGAEYVVNCEGGRPEEEWSPPSPGYMYIWRKSKEERPIAENVLDYEREMEISQAAAKSIASTAAKRRKKDALVEVSDAPTITPHSEYAFAASIEKLRQTWMRDKPLFRWIVAHPEETLSTVKDALKGKSVDIGVEWTNS